MTSHDRETANNVPRSSEVQRTPLSRFADPFIPSASARSISNLQYAAESAGGPWHPAPPAVQLVRSGRPQEAEEAQAPGRPLRTPSRTPSPAQRYEQALEGRLREGGHLPEGGREILEALLVALGPTAGQAQDDAVRVRGPDSPTSSELSSAPGARPLPPPSTPRPRPAVLLPSASSSRAPAPSSAPPLAPADAAQEDLVTQTVPVKSTFIHFDSDTSPGFMSDTSGRSNRSTSAPPSTIHQSVDALASVSPNESHLRGECRPCAYFWSKKDGCRHADSCKFCHDCPPGAVKKKKKEKRAMCKALAATARRNRDGSSIS